MKKYLLIGLFLLITTSINAQQVSVLVFSKTAGYRHDSIETGIEALKKMAEENNWKMTFSEDASIFNDKDLSSFSTLFFLNTTGDILNEEQQKAMVVFIEKGNGFVGIHAATDTEMEWEWYGEMTGAVFKNHPKIQKATVKLSKNHDHITIAHLKEQEVFLDEWYNFHLPISEKIEVLATLDESSYTGEQMGVSHPIIWYQIFQGARVFYTGLGHTKESFSDIRFLNQLKNAIIWTSGKEESEDVK
ncbi:ThuA domain-containing protein [Wenyingzhuangia sp. chi5]|uniref:ThuA domain-containing protein n=1 Tax=Wenyingzhuangia gilva TaxID=3057677 RepID=A0ABT8VNZ7_9FLAO|nr:ThuA domain-containing protein [Wenyingzhuangia sp. chi5]MDO3693682.1 ThuA domain-containing protein [Wenyingzhuangia sp. chi5]